MLCFIQHACIKKISISDVLQIYIIFKSCWFGLLQKQIYQHNYNVLFGPVFKGEQTGAVERHFTLKQFKDLMMTMVNNYLTCWNNIKIKNVEDVTLSGRLKQELQDFKTVSFHSLKLYFWVGE